MEQRTETTTRAATVSMTCIVDWIERQRSLHRRQARMLKDAERSVLGAYFGPVLDDIRVRVVQAMELPCWAWSQPARAPWSQAAPAVTLIDTIVISERALSAARPLLSVLFEGCVRAELYRLYGVQGFVEAYIEACRSDRPAYACVSFGAISQALLDGFEQGEGPFDVHAALYEALYEPLHPVASGRGDDVLADPTALSGGRARASQA